MKRRWLFLWSFLCVLGFFGLMHLKADVTTLARERIKLVKEQRRLAEDVRVLKAEYAHLTNPERLWTLAQERGFGEVQVQQLARLRVVPASGDDVRLVAWRP